MSSGDARIYLDLEVRRVNCRNCGAVKREQLAFLADNPFYTKRFAFYVGRRCRQAPIKDVAHELGLDWHTVKILEMQYMRAQLAKAGTPAPKAIGIDEISIRKGHSYRIVVSDLIRHRPIWFGGEDRSQASMAEFYKWLGDNKNSGIRLAVMDMWKPFAKATREHAPQAAILFDKFHIMRHLGEALDKVRKKEYARLSGKDQRTPSGDVANATSICVIVLTRHRKVDLCEAGTYLIRVRLAQLLRRQLPPKFGTGNAAFRALWRDRRSGSKTRRRRRVTRIIFWVFVKSCG